MIFSIIIPVYNAESSIVVCLDRLSKQLTGNYELIIVDDGSVDNSLIVINKFIENHSESKIKVISQKNQGAGAARNTGINAAEGEYIVFIDADDYVDNDFLDKTEKIIRECDVDVVFVDIVREDEKGNVIRYERMSDYRKLSRDRMIRWQLTGKMPWGGVRKVVRTSLVKNNNLLYATNIKVGEESIYSFRILELANNIAFQTKALYHYVDNSNSLTSNDVVSNSLSVYDFMTSYLRYNGKADLYASTIRAMAVTTAAIASNVSFNNKGLVKGYGAVKKILYEFKGQMKGHVDTDSLDKRVRLLMPCLRNGLILPIWFANRLQHYLKKNNYGCF